MPFFLHLLEVLLHCKIKLFYIKDTTVAGLGVPIFRVFTVSCHIVFVQEKIHNRKGKRSVGSNAYILDNNICLYFINDVPKY